MKLVLYLWKVILSLGKDKNSKPHEILNLIPDRCLYNKGETRFVETLEFFKTFPRV